MYVFKHSLHLNMQEKGLITMANPKKTAKASKKPSIDNLSQTHAALTPDIDMDKMFGITPLYSEKDLDEYSAKLKEMATVELQDHAHSKGVVPLDSRERLVAALERKFVEHKSQRLPQKSVPVKINPDMAEWHKKWSMGVYGN